MNYIEYHGETLKEIIEERIPKYFDYLHCKECNDITKHWRNENYLMKCENCNKLNYIDLSRTHKEIRFVNPKQLFSKYYCNVKEAKTIGNKIQIKYQDLNDNICNKIITLNDFKRDFIKYHTKMDNLNYRKGFKRIKLFFHEDILECKGYKRLWKYFSWEYFDKIEINEIITKRALKESGICFLKIIIQKKGIRIFFDERIYLHIEKRLRSGKFFCIDLKIDYIDIPFYDQFDQFDIIYGII